jgi:hypothetical protein
MLFNLSQLVSVTNLNHNKGNLMNIKNTVILDSLTVHELKNRPDLQNQTITHKGV